MCRKILFLLLTILGLSCPSLAQGWPVHLQWEVSLFGGLNAPTDQDFLTPVEGQGDPFVVALDYASGYTVGGRVSENLGQHFGAELEYSFSNQPLFLQNVAPGTSFGLDHKTHRVVYSFLYSPQDRFQKIRPFVLAGVGATFFQVDKDSEGQALLQNVDLNDQWKFTFSWGGGVKAQLAEQWGIRIDVKDHITGVPDYGLPSTAPLINGGIGAGLRPDGVMHNWQLSVGFTYSWGL